MVLVQDANPVLSSLHLNVRTFDAVTSSVPENANVIDVELVAPPSLTASPSPSVAESIVDMGSVVSNVTLVRLTMMAAFVAASCPSHANV